MTIDLDEWARRARESYLRPSEILKLIALARKGQSDDTAYYLMEVERNEAVGRAEVYERALRKRLWAHEQRVFPDVCHCDDCEEARKALEEGAKLEAK